MPTTRKLRARSKTEAIPTADRLAKLYGIVGGTTAALLEAIAQVIRALHGH